MSTILNGNSMTLLDIIFQLSAIHLEDTPECRGLVHRLVDRVFPIHWLHHPLKTGTIISRCRKDAQNLEKESFGCKRPENVISFQRASIPHQSVFYGAVGDRDAEDGDFIAMMETSSLHRKGRDKGQELIFVSQWRVAKDIDMALICHPNVFVDAYLNSTINAMQENYKRRLPDYPAEQEFIPIFDKLVEFVSEQFAKRVSEGDNFQYMISSYFAHNSLLTESGIIYPSVQVNGKLGFNVALRPDIVENSLEFIGAEKHILYKAKEYMQVPAGVYSDEHLAASLGIGSLDNLPVIK